MSAKTSRSAEPLIPDPRGRRTRRADRQPRPRRRSHPAHLTGRRDRRAFAHVDRVDRRRSARPRQHARRRSASAADDLAVPDPSAVLLRRRRGVDLRVASGHTSRTVAVASCAAASASGRVVPHGRPGRLRGVDAGRCHRHRRRRGTPGSSVAVVPRRLSAGARRDAGAPTTLVTSRCAVGSRGRVAGDGSRRHASDRRRSVESAWLRQLSQRVDHPGDPRRRVCEASVHDGRGGAAGCDGSGRRHCAGGPRSVRGVAGDRPRAALVQYEPAEPATRWAHSGAVHTGHRVACAAGASGLAPTCLVVGRARQPWCDDPVSVAPAGAGAHHRPLHGVWIASRSPRPVLLADGSRDHDMPARADDPGDRCAVRPGEPSAAVVGRADRRRLE